MLLWVLCLKVSVSFFVWLLVVGILIVVVNVGFGLIWNIELGFCVVGDFVGE